MNTYQSGVEKRLSYTTANFMEAQNTGRLGENPFSYLRDETTQWTGFINTAGKGLFDSKIEASGTQGGVVTPDLLSISDARAFNLANQVKQKLSQKIYSQDVNLAVVYAERAQTLELLREGLTKLRKAYSAAKLGRLGDALAALGVSPRSRDGSLNNRGNIARGWLEIQYGWLPLLSDIFGTVNALYKQSIDRSYVMVKAGSSIQETESEQVSSLNGTCTDYISRSAKLTISARVKMTCTTTSIREAKELGLTNPLFVVWEKVPFSFVVDWAVPIGSFLQQFDASLGWHLDSGSITTFSERESINNRSSNGVPASYEVFEVGGYCSAKSISCDRVGLGSFVELWTLPYVKNPASLLHAANALALLNSKR